MTRFIGSISSNCKYTLCSVRFWAAVAGYLALLIFATADNYHSGAAVWYLLRLSRAFGSYYFSLVICALPHGVVCGGMVRRTVCLYLCKNRQKRICRFGDPIFIFKCLFCSVYRNISVYRDLLLDKSYHKRRERHSIHTANSGLRQRRTVV